MTYVLASFFIDQILAFLGPTATVDFNTVVAVFDQGTFALAFLGALTPIPYTVVAIVAGALKGSLIMFILGSFVGRVIRFGIVAYFTYYFGDRAIELAKKHLVFSSIVAVLVVCAYILYKVLL
jgi:membrane protein YqaA with SNARE-associated domain